MSEFALQALVFALDKAEKKHFSELAEEGKHYAQLFEDLNKLPRLKESDFKKRYQERGYMANYSYNKNYLFNSILDAMRSQRKRGGWTKGIHLQVGEMLEDAEFLHQKMLYDLSLKRLLKAEKEARKYELLEDLLKVLRLKGRYTMSNQARGHGEEARELYEEMNQVASAIQNQYAFLDLRNQLFLLARKTPEARKPEQLEDLAQLRNHPLLKSSEMATSFNAKLNFHFCKSMLSQMDGELPSAYIHQKNLYLLWEDNPNMQKLRPVAFRNSLNNFLLHCCAVKEYDNFVNALDKLEKGPFRSQNERAEAKVNGLYVRVQMFLDCCRWEDAKEVEKEFSKGLEDFADKLIPSRILAFYLSFAQLNWVLRNRKKAMRWLKRILDDPNQEVRKDIIRHVRVLDTVLNFEEGRFSKMENSRRAAVRVLEKEGTSLEFEDLVLSLLVSVTKACNKQEHKDCFEKAARQMAKLQDKPRESNALGFFYLNAWISALSQSISLKSYLESQLSKPNPNPGSL